MLRARLLWEILVVGMGGGGLEVALAVWRFQRCRLNCLGQAEDLCGGVLAQAWLHVEIASKDVPRRGLHVCPATITVCAVQVLLTRQ
jgi:hypothetical protein